MPGPRRPARGTSAGGTSIFSGIYPRAGPHAVAENLRSALPDTTIIAAIHHRTLADVSVPTDATFRLAAGRVVPRDQSGTHLEPVGCPSLIRGDGMSRASSTGVCNPVTVPSEVAYMDLT